ncbi:MAG: LPXTG cell wall anchor domain-containing protein, partial [Firmicutes bacterium]|nr:LPXTG cell wall anchor domain-containing protein [Bacillota bacterium]
LVCVGETDETGRLLMEARLPMGRYYLMELGGPCEYELSDVQYEVEISGETINESGKIVIEVSDAPIVNYLITYPVTITKSDLTDGTPLAGAIIEIHNEKGETIYRGVTDENGEMDEIELTPGTYTFTEISAPAGYEKSEEIITFTLSEDGEITGETEMKDKRIPEEPEKPGNPDVPNTGDSSVDMLTVLGIVLLVAAGGMLIVIEVKKRVRRER